ncbi:hypothetical protein [Streptomyces sp. NPDC004270]
MSSPSGTTHGEQAGASADARFMHLWTVRDGKLAKLQQVSDSLVVDRVING